jgi:uncharacterized protein
MPTPRRLISLATLTALAVAALAGPASAHVTVHADGEAVQGGFTTLAVQVPTESDKASTTKVQVQLPPTTPLAFVSVQPHPGWTYAVSRTKLAQPLKTDDGEVTDAVSAITWTASSAASGIKPGEFDRFLLSAGPLPKVDSLQFKAVQTYSDGRVVRWIQDAPAGQPEPQFPAPTLQLTSSDATAGAGTTPAAPTAAAPSAKAASSSSAGWALGLSVVALLLALGALLTGLRRNRGGAAPSSAVSRDRVSVD